MRLEPRPDRLHLFFDPRPHRWTGRLGSGNDEWFFFPLRVLLIVGAFALILRALR
jgi:hypothetical protein